MRPPLEDLRFGDLRTFLTVQRQGAVTAAARELRVTPSQVSKSLSRVEAQLGARLVARSSRGVTLTAAGRRILPEIEAIATDLTAIRSSREAGETSLVIAGASWLVNAFVPAITRRQPALRIRALEMPHALVRAHVADNIFDVALLGGARDLLPETWSRDAVGTVRKAIFTTPRVAAQLGEPPVDPARLREVPFIRPIYNVAGRYLPADDDCPLPMSERRPGHETQTVPLALELARATDQVAFVPSVSARAFVDEGALVEVRVRGWDVTEEVTLVCNTVRVLARVKSAAVLAVRAVLDEA